ncbi:hypothetical protein [Paraburkholderia sediminicola]|uniref:hypothetical protein n=1 Tax=Paraburkholderia sediminicola TaxID=458836 RepID=UPI0038BAF87A
MDSTNPAPQMHERKFAPTYIERNVVELLSILLADVAGDVGVAARDAGISEHHAARADVHRIRRTQQSRTQPSAEDGAGGCLPEIPDSRPHRKPTEHQQSTSVGGDVPESGVQSRRKEDALQTAQRAWNNAVTVQMQERHRNRQQEHSPHRTDKKGEQRNPGLDLVDERISGSR